MAIELSNAPATLQKRMTSILRDVIDELLATFSYNLLIFSNTDNERYKYVAIAVKWLKEII